MAIKKEGAFVEIALPNGKFGYGRILNKGSYAFYDIYSDIRLTDMKEISKHQVLFICALYKSASKAWFKIGYAPLEETLLILPMKFIEDGLQPGNFELYDPNTGETTPASKEQCIGLERASVWDSKQVESRIIDYFEGKPNVWVEQLKLK